MTNNLLLIKKVLQYIYEHKKVTLDETVMNCAWGFQQLAEEGYIIIQKIDSVHIATLTRKGIEILIS
jgi:hypothetical protein